MAEEALQQQEFLRLKAERLKQQVKSGVKEEATVERQVNVEIQDLFQAKLDNSAIREYIRREHDEFHTILEAEVRHLISNQDKALKQQEIQVANLKGEVSDLHDRLSELMDNFNLYVSEERKNHAAHRERVQRTCDLLDKELSYR